MAAFWRKRTFLLKKQNSSMNLLWQQKKRRLQNKRINKRISKLAEKGTKNLEGKNYCWRSNMCTKKNEEGKKPRFWWIHCGIFKIFWKKRLDSLVVRGRPISLLNVVYKTAASGIAERTKEVLPTLISEDQTGIMANRFTENNTRFIYDLINCFNTNRLNGLLLWIDFEKAFDHLTGLSCTKY